MRQKKLIPMKLYYCSWRGTQTELLVRARSIREAKMLFARNKAEAVSSLLPPAHEGRSNR